MHIKYTLSTIDSEKWQNKNHNYSFFSMQSVCMYCTVLYLSIHFYTLRPVFTFSSPLPVMRRFSILSKLKNAVCSPTFFCGCNTLFATEHTAPMPLRRRTIVEKNTSNYVEKWAKKNIFSRKFQNCAPKNDNTWSTLSQWILMYNAFYKGHFWYTIEVCCWE